MMTWSKEIIETVLSRTGSLLRSQTFSGFYLSNGLKATITLPRPREFVMTEVKMYEGEIVIHGIEKRTPLAGGQEGYSPLALREGRVDSKKNMESQINGDSSEHWCS
jgi:hypothetical protein